MEGTTYKGVTVKKGDRIKVQAPTITVTGTVVTVEHWDYDMDRQGNIVGGGWYIQMTDANVPGGFSYWKQGCDGGKIVEINGKEVK
jgi:hypothetical protein